MLYFRTKSFHISLQVTHTCLYSIKARLYPAHTGIHFPELFNYIQAELLLDRKSVV